MIQSPFFNGEKVMINRLENFAYDARITIGKGLAIVEPATDWLPFVSTVINIVEFLTKGALWAVENRWKPSEKNTPLLHYVAKKDICKRSLLALVPVLGNIYIIYQDVCNHHKYLEHLKLVVDETILDNMPHLCNNVKSTKDFNGTLRSCGDYGVFSREGEGICIAVCLDGKVQEQYSVDSFRLIPVNAYGKEYFTLSGRDTFFSHFIAEVYSSLLFPNRDRVVSHITDETCVKLGPWQKLHHPYIKRSTGYQTYITTELASKELSKIPPKLGPTSAFGYCKVGDLLLDQWPSAENLDGVVHIKVSQEEAKPIKIDDLRDALKNNKVKGPAVEKFIEIWQRKISALSEPNS